MEQLDVSQMVSPVADIEMAAGAFHFAASRLHPPAAAAAASSKIIQLQKSHTHVSDKCY